jgi:hypothetical protein
VQAVLNDATTAFLRAIRRFFASAGTFTLEEVRSRSWASVTFVGARHEIAFRIEGEGAEQEARRFLRRLDVAEFELPGHILADVALVSEERRPGRVRIRIEALTVEDR